MPQIVPVSDFRANIKSVSDYTDQGEVVILTHNGRPKWAMVPYDEWNAAAKEYDHYVAAAIRELEERERSDEMEYHTPEEARAMLEERHRRRMADAVRKAS